MSFGADTFTEKALKAVQESEAKAREESNFQLSPIHLAWALLADKDGLFRQVIGKCSVDVQGVERAISKLLVRLPKQEPAPETIGPNRNFLALLQKAQETQRANDDSYLAIDHLVVALVNNAEMAAALSESGLNKAAVENAI